MQTAVHWPGQDVQYGLTRAASALLVGASDGSVGD